MKLNEFQKLCHERYVKCMKVLEKKRTYYAPEDDDRLKQFKEISNFSKTTPIDSALDLMSKHLTAWRDALKAEVTKTPDEMWDEWFTDLHNYLYLIEALVKDYKKEHGKLEQLKLF